VTPQVRAVLDLLVAQAQGHVLRIGRDCITVEVAARPGEGGPELGARLRVGGLELQTLLRGRDR
jgi:hypothetical protein